MIVHIANPIYDSVFKYIMEDERIAKTVLSALLKKEVLHVTMRPHEYANTSRDTLSMFRIDFAAMVCEEDGSQQVILIELQKTWLDTETLRFRQYLGVQYSNKNNIQVDSKKGYAYPMVAVYLLGHCVGDIPDPVIYVNHKAYNYDGQEVSKGMPNPFVESLTHNSIIVQIPLLRGQVNNRLEKVLSVFDQSKKNTRDAQVLNIDETCYQDDADIMYLIHRLTAAAADADVRTDMNVEDEYFSAIEDRDTAIMKKDQELKQRESELKQKESEIKQKDKDLKQKDKDLKQKDEDLKQKDEDLKQKDEDLKQKDEDLKQKDLMLKAMVNAMIEKGMDIQDISLLVNKDVAFLEELIK